MKTQFKTLLLILGFLWISVDSGAQTTSEIAGAAYGAMSNAGIGDNDVWQGFLNPAGIMVDSDSWEAGVSYLNRFGLAELSSKNLVASTPLGNGRIGLAVHSFGYDSFSQNQFSGAYAMKLSEKLRAGVQLNYFSVNIAEGYGRFSAFTANLGLQYDFNSKVSVGFLVRNPNRATISSEVQEYVQSVIATGIKYKLADNLTVLADVSKDLDFDLDVSFGMEYIPVEKWFIRAGAATLNKGISFGFGYKPAKWSIDLASMYHQILGFSPMISLTYRNE